MAPFLVFLLPITFAARVALAQSQFINPPEGKTTLNPNINSIYRVGDVVNIAWTTNEKEITLIINQLNSPLTEIDYLPNSVALTQPSYVWKVTIDGSDGGSKFNLSFNNQFNFMLFPVNSTAPEAQSTYFNITDATHDQYGNTISTSTSSTPTTRPISTASSSITSTTAVVSSPTGTSAATKASPPNTVSSTSTTKLTLGSVLGVVALLVIIAVMAYLYVWRKKRREQQAQNIPPPQHFRATYKEAVQQHGNEVSGPLPELETSKMSTRRVAELPS